MWGCAEIKAVASPGLSASPSSLSLRLPSFPVSTVRDVLDFRQLEQEAGFKVRDAEIILKQWLPFYPLEIETRFSLHLEVKG